MPTTYVEFTHNPAIAGNACAICAPAIMLGTIGLRRLTVQAPGNNRVKLTRHAANASGGTSLTIRPMSDGGAPAITVLRTGSVTYPNSANIELTAKVKSDGTYSENVIEPSDGDRLSIGQGHSIALSFLDDHDADYVIGILLEEPSL